MEHEDDVGGATEPDLGSAAFEPLLHTRCRNPLGEREKLRRNLADTEQGTRESVSEYDPTQSYPAIKA